MGNHYIPSVRPDTLKRKCEWSERQWRRFHQMLADGATRRQMSESLGVSDSVIDKRVADWRAEQEKAA